MDHEPSHTDMMVAALFAATLCKMHNQDNPDDFYAMLDRCLEIAKQRRDKTTDEYTASVLNSYGAIGAP